VPLERLDHHVAEGVLLVRPRREEREALRVGRAQLVRDRVDLQLLRRRVLGHLDDDRKPSAAALARPAPPLSSRERDGPRRGPCTRSAPRRGKAAARPRTAGRVQGRREITSGGWGVRARSTSGKRWVRARVGGEGGSGGCAGRSSGGAGRSDPAAAELCTVAELSALLQSSLHCCRALCTVAELSALLQSSLHCCRALCTVAELSALLQNSLHCGGMHAVFPSQAARQAPLAAGGRGPLAPGRPHRRPLAAGRCERAAPCGPPRQTFPRSISNQLREWFARARRCNGGNRPASGSGHANLGAPAAHQRGRTSHLLIVLRVLHQQHLRRKAPISGAI